MRARLSSTLAHLRQILTNHCDGGLSDADLLHRYVTRRDEAAFEVLVWRHGPMVLGVANRVLRNSDDAEDVLQATFLALVRQAKSIGRGAALSSWLYRVAYRTALRIRSRREKRSAADDNLDAIAAASPADNAFRQDELDALDRELQTLPEKYRDPLVLSYLQGLSNREIATQMGCPIGTVFTRLARGRERLRKRLAERGATFGSLLTVPVTAIQPLRGGLVQLTLKTAAVIAKRSSVETVSPEIVDLAEQASKAMSGSSRPKLIASVLVFLAVAGSGIGLVAGHSTAHHAESARVGAEEAEPATASEPAKAASNPPKSDQPGNVDRPRVTQVYPADRATEVNSITEIRIRFDRPMNRNNTSVNWLGKAQAGFRPRGELRYDETTHEFMLPVQLSPGCKHEVIVNSDGKYPGGDKSYRGFRSESLIAAEPFQWSFSTAKLASLPGKPPTVVTLNPPSDSEVALLTPLEVAFDRPMDPLAYGLAIPDTTMFDRRPDLLGSPAYDAERHRFTMLIRLPANWNGALRLEGFRGEDGVAAETQVVKYHTLRKVVSDVMTKTVAQAGRSAKLRALVERIRKTRRELKSLAEDAVQVGINYQTSPDWYQSYSSQGSRFLFQGSDRFLGVVDDTMLTPFRVGCDGSLCWARMGNERYIIPAKNFGEKHVLLCDPFNAAAKTDVDRLIGELKLEYRGDAIVRGRRCHWLRSWDIRLDPYHSPFAPREWFFDAESLLPLRMQSGFIGTFRIDYTYSRVNQPIPDKEFLADAGPGISDGSIRLAEGYTQRFLTVNDGSAGRMAVNWSMKGPKGQSTSGQN